MPNPVFPTMVSDPDSRGYSMTPEDPAITTEMEGGYVVSRARHTRAPRRTFKITYTSIIQADKVLLENFFDTVRGGSVIFDWTNPENGVLYQVRFKGGISFNFVGIKNYKRWDVSFSVEQA